jgi:thioredoxin-like negative regulator of GroEL
MVAALIIEKGRRQGGLPPLAALDLARAEPSPGPQASATAASSVADVLVDPVTGVRLTRIQQLETAVKGGQANADIFLELARLYLDKGREYEAERLLTRARDETGRDARILGMSEDVTMLRLAKKVSAAERDVELEDTPQTRTALAQIVKERDRIEIEIFQERSRRDPDDLSVRYELGRRLARAGKLDQARPYFEQALQHETSRCHAALALGGSLLSAGQAAEAQRHFRMAAASAGQTGQAACQGEALLQAAQVAARGKLLRLARRYVTQLLKLDPGHQAGTALLEALERRAV